MAEHYSSHAPPEVFGRSSSDAVEEPPAGPVVEPDPVILGVADASDSIDDDEEEDDGEVQVMTMWMRIAEEKKRRAREAACDENGAA